MSNMTGKKQYDFPRLFYNEKWLNLCNYVANHYAISCTVHSYFGVHVYYDIHTYISMCCHNNKWIACVFSWDDNLPWGWEFGRCTFLA